MFFFVFPPVSMAVSTLRFLESQKVEGIFIIPIWPTSSWFHSFFEDGSHCYQWVQKLVVFWPNFIPNIHSPSCFAPIVTFEAAAMHFNFKRLKLGGKIVVDKSLCIHGGCSFC